MPDPSTVRRLKGLLLNAVELRAITEWPQALIEDYLNIFDNLILIANLLDVEIDQKIEDIPTDFTDGSIPFAEDGNLAEDNARLFWDNVDKMLSIVGDLYVSGDVRGKNRAKQYFFAGF